MIRVVGANPALDRVATWPPLRLGEVNRAVSVSVAPGGKGFNVARAVIRLGRLAAAYGFLGGHVGEALRDMVVAEGVIDRHTTIAAGTRVCFIVVERDPPRTTVLNEPGPPVSPAEIERFLAGLTVDVGPGDLLVVAGSLPDSVPPAVAGRIVGIGKAAGARTLLDIHGAALRIGIEAAPWMVKCNRASSWPWSMPTARTRADRPVTPSPRYPRSPPGWSPSVLRASSSSWSRWARRACFSRTAQASCMRLVPRVDAVNPTGSGDLVLAGLAVGLERGSDATRRARPRGRLRDRRSDAPPARAAARLRCRCLDVTDHHLDGGAGLIEGLAVLRPPPGGS